MKKADLLADLERIVADVTKGRLNELRLKIIADKEDTDNFFVDLDYLGK